MSSVSHFLATGRCQKLQFFEALEAIIEANKQTLYVKIHDFTRVKMKRLELSVIVEHCYFKKDASRSLFLFLAVTHHSKL